MTPLRLLELLFDDVLVDVIVGYIMLYSHREKTVIGFETNDKKIPLFVSMLLLSGCHKLPDRKIYCVQTLILLLMQGQIQWLVICVRVFFEISIFVTTNNLINKKHSQSFFLRLIRQI